MRLGISTGSDHFRISVVSGNRSTAFGVTLFLTAMLYGVCFLISPILGWIAVFGTVALIVIVVVAAIAHGISRIRK